MDDSRTYLINLATICSNLHPLVLEPREIERGRERERERDREREAELKLLHRIVVTKLPRYDDIAGEFTSGRALQFRLGRRSLTCNSCISINRGVPTRARRKGQVHC